MQRLIGVILSPRWECKNLDSQCMLEIRSLCWEARWKVLGRFSVYMIQDSHLHLCARKALICKQLSSLQVHVGRSNYKMIYLTSFFTHKIKQLVLAGKQGQRNRRKGSWKIAGFEYDFIPTGLLVILQYGPEMTHGTCETFPTTINADPLPWNISVSINSNFLTKNIYPHFPNQPQCQGVSGQKDLHGYWIAADEKTMQRSLSKLPCLPEAWTSMMYWCKSCPCWMTSKVMLFMASFRSVWRCKRCSARVRSSVLKSFICLSKSSFQASNSAVTFKGKRQTRSVPRPTRSLLQNRIWILIIL